MTGRLAAVTGLEIAVVGMAGRFPGAADVDGLWTLLRTGTPAVRPFTDEEMAADGVPETVRDDPRYVAVGGVLADPEMFDAGYFGYSPREAAMLDPQQRVFLECAQHALEHAGRAGADRGIVGVYAGASLSTYLLRHLLGAAPGARDALELVLSNDKDSLAARAAYHLGLTGPAVGVQTACSSSLTAVHLACQALLARDCDLALAGGVSIRLPQHEGYRHHEGSILSAQGRCLPFDARADGVVGGNGAALVVLKPLADAVRDGDTVHAVIKGSAIGNDGAARVGFTAPGVAGQRAVIRDAHRVAEIPAATIGYVEAHGTATALGDPIEVAALTGAFRAGGDERRGGCALGSVKAMVGHLDAAAGVTGLIKAVLAVRDGVLPPSPYFTAPNPALELDRTPFTVHAQPRDWPPAPHSRRAGVSAFGMGGTNVHVVLEEPPPAAPAEPPGPHQLLVLAAHSENALADARAALSRHLAADATPLADVAATLAAGRRTDLRHRLAVVCADRPGAVAQLAAGGRAAVRPERRRPVAFLFPGQGAQHPRMAAGIYREHAAFRAAADECAELLRPHLGRDIRALIGLGDVPPADPDLLSRTWYAQPALFTVEYALSRLWESWGVRPVAMAGHSIGEYVAACLAGVLDLPDALALVAARGELMRSLPAGGMLAVHLGADRVLPLLARVPGLALAADNAPEVCTVSGPDAPLDDLAGLLAAERVQTRRLRTSHAFHSAMVEPMLAEFGRRVASVGLRPPAVPVVSTATGQPLSAAEATDPAYWVGQTRGTVRFRPAVGTLAEGEPPILLEVGPGGTLSALARQHDRIPAGHPVVTSLPRARADRADTETVLAALGRIWLAGGDADPAGPLRFRRQRRVPLPLYPFQRTRHWIDAPGAAREPEPERAPGPVAAPVAAPADEVYELVAATWRDLLGVAAVGPDDDFFELGGHSLLANRILARLSDALGTDLPAGAIFEAPTPAALATLAAARRGRDQAPTAHPDTVPATRAGTEAELSRLLAEVRGMSADELRAELDRESAG